MTFNAVYTFFVKLATLLNLYNMRHQNYVEIIEDLIQRFIQRSENLIILDIGSGKGYISSFVGDRFKSSTICLDIDEKSLQHSPKTIFPLVGDGHFLPFKPNSFDIVLMISVLEHLKDPLHCIIQNHKILKKSGICIVQLPNLKWFLEPHTKFPFLFFLPKMIKKIAKDMTNYQELNFDVSLQNVISWFKRSGLKEIERIPQYHNLKLLKIIRWPPSWFMVFIK